MARYQEMSLDSSRGVLKAEHLSNSVDKTS